MNNHRQCKTTEGGQTLLITTVLFVSLTVVVTGLFATAGVSQYQNSRDFLNSQRGFFASESALEDVALRVKTNNDPAATTNYPILFSTPVGSVTYDINDDIPTRVQHAVSSSIQSAVRKVGFQLLAAETGEVSFDNSLQVGKLGLILKNNTVIKGAVFSNGPIIGAPNVKIFLKKGKSLKTARPLPDPKPVWEPAPEYVGVVRRYETVDKLAQQFVPEQTGLLQAISVKICLPSTFTGTLYLRIHGNIDQDAAGTNVSEKPAGNNLTSGLVNNAGLATAGGSVCTPQWIKIPVTPLTVQGGEKYWFILDTPACTTNCNNKWYRVGLSTEVDPNYGNGQAVWGGDIGVNAVWCASTASPACTTIAAMNGTAAIQAYALMGVPVEKLGRSDLAFRIHINTESNDVSNLSIFPCYPDNGGTNPCDENQAPSGSSPQNWCSVATTNGQAAYSNTFTNVTMYVPGHASYNSINACNTEGSIVNDYAVGDDQQDPPISTPQIEIWKNTAALQCAGATTYGSCACTAAEGCSGTSLPVNGTQTFPSAGGDINKAHVPGTITIGSGAKLAVRNYVYVGGDLTCENSGTIYIDSSADEGRTFVIVVEGKIWLKNGCTVMGRDANGIAADVGPPYNDDPQSHLVLVSLSNKYSVSDPAIDAQNNVKIDILHAHNGMLTLANNAKSNVVYGDGIQMENNTEVASLREIDGNVVFADTPFDGGGTANVPTGWGEQ